MNIKNWLALTILAPICAIHADVHCGMHLMYGNPGGVDQVLCRTGYASGYSYKYKAPLWASFSITSASSYNDHKAARQNDFRPDSDIPTGYQSTTKDYDEPIYDQGHMADSAVIDFSKVANSETFLMSNVTPQIPEMNRAAFGKKGAWGTLENNIRSWVKMRGHLLITSGAIYDSEPETIGNGVAVPSYIYKIVMDVKTNNSIAFLFPAKDQNTGDRLKCYLVSIDDIEAITGLDFFKDIEDKHEAEIESYKEEALWPTKTGTTTKDSQTQC